MAELTFGEGPGAIGGDHKDTYIFATGGTSSTGGEPDVDVDGVTRWVGLFRFSLAGHIPPNAVVSTAVFTLIDDGTRVV
jgi:hypothetical protein